jgi:tetratricopeptide (TPR) repeat protein
MIEGLLMAVESFFTRWRKAVRPLPREAPSAALLALKRRQRKLIQRTVAILVLGGAGGWIYSYWVSAPDRAEEETALAVKLLGVGTYDQAMRHFDRAIQIWPSYADAYLNRGLAEHGAGHSPAALADLDRALNFDHSLTQAYNARGQIYLENGDVQQTIRECSKSIQVNPSVDAYYQRGEAYEKLGEHQKAIADFDAAISESREAPFAYHARSMARRNAGDREGAQADDDQARRIETGQSVDPDVLRAP